MALVVIGGIKRIAGVSQIIVPFMAITYILFAVLLLLCNLQQVPGAIVTIVTSAFAPQAALGGVIGVTIKDAIQNGVARLGSAPIAAAAAQTREPVRQGLVTMTGTFIDTIVVCTMTGLAIVLTESWVPELGLKGVQITTRAFQVGLPFPSAMSAFILMLCLIFFAFTTILGWNYYGERCLEYFTTKPPSNAIVGCISPRSLSALI